MFSTVTCQPKRRRIAWPRAIREKIAAAIKEKILGVMPTSTIAELRVCAYLAIIAAAAAIAFFSLDCLVDLRIRKLPNSENPYLQTKALALVLDGTPTQAITIEKLRHKDYDLQYIPPGD